MQIIEIEDGAKSLSYNPAESIATPQEADFKDEQLRTMLASPLCVQERGANAERLQAYHSERESLMLISSRDPIVTGKPVSVFSSQSKLNQDTVSERDQFLSKLVDQPLFGSSVRSVFKFANLANVVKSLLNGNKDHLLIQARSD